VNEQRNHFFSDKNATRVKGLTDVIERMEASLAHDRKDLEYLSKKTNSNSIKSLELQLIKVKTNMLNETIASKEEKLKDIRLTLEKIQKQGQKPTKKEKDPSKAPVNEPETETDDTTSKAEEATHPDVPNPSSPE